MISRSRNGTQIRSIEKIEPGRVTINNVVISDSRIPFADIKNSAFGRELSRYDMLEFVNIKPVRFYDQLVYGPYVG